MKNRTKLAGTTFEILLISLMYFKQSMSSTILPKLKTTTLASFLENLKMPFEYSNKTHSKYTDVFRTLSDIYDSLLQKQLTAESCYLFSQKHSILDI